MASHTAARFLRRGNEGPGALFIAIGVDLGAMPNMPDSSEAISQRAAFGSLLIERGALTADAHGRALRLQAESGRFPS